MDQLQISVTAPNSASGFLHFLLIGSTISACRAEKRNKRATGKGDQEYLHRKMKHVFQTITFIIKIGFERYILTKNKENYQ